MTKTEHDALTFDNLTDDELRHEREELVQKKLWKVRQRLHSVWVLFPDRRELIARELAVWMNSYRPE